MATLTAAAPNYRRELGEGLIQRWSTPEDTENIAQLCGMVFRDKDDEPLNVHAIDSVRQHMSGDFPLMGPGDYAVIEDTRREGNPLVACTCLWRQEWEYEGMAFGVGQPEFVVTHPDYRNRGLIRALFDMVHARSEAEGHRDVQAHRRPDRDSAHRDRDQGIQRDQAVQRAGARQQADGSEYGCDPKHHRGD